jgi:hypothetical protein
VVTVPVFLSPLGGLVALAAVLPVAAALLRERRLRGLRGELGLASPGRDAVATALAGAAAVALLGLAAAQPALSRARGVAARTDAEVYAVFDTTRSMLAVRRAAGPTRFERARGLAVHLRDELPEVPWGIATFSDRALITIFPTLNRGLFAAAADQSIGPLRPAPGYRERNVTSIQTLTDLADMGFFSPQAKRRVAVVLTDGETQPVSARELAKTLGNGRVHLLVLRLWNAHDRVYDRHGRDAGYRPDPSSERQLASLRAAGILIVPERDAAAVPGIVRRWLGSGPTATPRTQSELVPLAPAAILAAVVPLAFVLVRSRR